MVPRVKCPGVGPEVMQKKTEGSGGVCPPQPPACCEAAERAEAAVDRITETINGNAILKALQLGEMPWWMAVASAPPATRLIYEVESSRHRGREPQVLAGF